MFGKVTNFFKKFHKDAKKPSKTHETDFCHDVYATTVEDLGGGRVKYGLGIGIQSSEIHKAIAENMILAYSFRARSSIHKTGLILSNGVGTIDMGYIGEIQAVFYNIIPELPNYKVGDRIGQIHMEATCESQFVEVDEFEETDRGDAGYGSTGER